MIFAINVFGATCKECNKPIVEPDFIHGKFYMKVNQSGDLVKSTGYLDLYHKGCG